MKFQGRFTPKELWAGVEEYGEFSLVNSLGTYFLGLHQGASNPFFYYFFVDEKPSLNLTWQKWIVISRTQGEYLLKKVMELPNPSLIGNCTSEFSGTYK